MITQKHSFAGLSLLRQTFTSVRVRVINCCFSQHFSVHKAEIKTHIRDFFWPVTTSAFYPFSRITLINDFFISFCRIFFVILYSLCPLLLSLEIQFHFCFDIGTGFITHFASTMFSPSLGNVFEL